MLLIVAKCETLTPFSGFKQQRQAINQAMFCLIIIEILSPLFVHLTLQTVYNFTTNLFKYTAFQKRFETLHFATMLCNVTEFDQCYLTEG